MKSGAGGNWRRFDEKFDASIVKQKDLSCVAAVGEMLLRERGIIFTQDKILGIIGEKASIYDLKDVLNEADKSSKWKGGYAIDDSTVFGKEKFLAVLQEPLNLGHAVFVKGIDEQGYFLINDPADQTAYRMTQKDFLENWGGGIIFYEKD
jgi:ABC-type bacteriocin/lantibiotic exporter with double-glycine peptidase domain